MFVLSLPKKLYQKGLYQGLSVHSRRSLGHVIVIRLAYSVEIPLHPRERTEATRVCHTKYMRTPHTYVCDSATGELESLR